MVVIKCRIIAKPQEGTRPIFRKVDDGKRSILGPIIRGKSGGRLKYAYNVSRRKIAVDAVFQCPHCHKYNEA
jgi:hypothetical protein